jgi:hypothetical protein
MLFPFRFPDRPAVSNGTKTMELSSSITHEAIINMKTKARTSNESLSTANNILSKEFKLIDFKWARKFGFLILMPKISLHCDMKIK